CRAEPRGCMCASPIVRVQDRVRRTVEPADPIERVAAHLHGRDVARGDGGANGGGGARDRHEPSTRGTLKSPAAGSAAGASPSSRSRGSDPAGWSSRNTVSDGVVTDAAVTFDVSTCWIWSA